LLEAGRNAERVPSYRTAADHYRQAWDLAETAMADGATERTLQEHAVLAGIGIGRMAVIYNARQDPDLEPVLQRGRALATTLNDPATLSGYCSYLGITIMNGDRNRFAEGLAMVEEGLTVAQRAGLHENAVNISRALAFSYTYDGRFALARRTTEWLLSELERLGHRERLTDLYMGARFLNESMRHLSEPPAQVMAALRDVYEMGVRGNNRAVQTGCAASLAQLHFIRAEYGEAKQWAERSITVAEAIGNVAGIRTAGAVLLGSRLALGEPVALARFVEMIEQQFQAPGDFSTKSHFLVDVLLCAGEVKRARRIAQTAYERAGGRMRDAMSATALGDVLRHLGPEHWREAQRWYDQALALAAAIESRPLLALAALGAAELAAARGDTALAERHGRQALGLCRELGYGRYEARAARVLAEASAPAPAAASA
jgi:tetratricopeptide (TPR) repeat protein